ncbi:Coat protein, partial [Frankliniella fusca]
RITAHKSLLSRNRLSYSETGKWLKGVQRAPLSSTCHDSGRLRRAHWLCSGVIRNATCLRRFHPQHIHWNYSVSDSCPPSLWAREPNMLDPTTTNAAEFLLAEQSNLI